MSLKVFKFKWRQIYGLTITRSLLLRVLGPQEYIYLKYIAIGVHETDKGCDLYSIVYIIRQFLTHHFILAWALVVLQLSCDQLVVKRVIRTKYHAKDPLRSYYTKPLIYLKQIGAVTSSRQNFSINDVLLE